MAQVVLPELTGRVVDNANLIGADRQQVLEQKLEAHEKKTGNQVVVVTINSLNGAVLESYTIDLARKWGLGRKDKNNGVLFLIAKNDRKMRIEVGYGLEGRLTDALSSIIIRKSVRPAFRAGNFPLGIEAGVDDILNILDAGAEELDAWNNLAEQNQNEGDTDFLGVAFIIVWLVIFFGAAFISVLVRTFGKEIKPGHYRWLGMDAGPKAPKKHRNSGWTSGGGGFGGSSGGGFSGGGGGFGGGGSSGGW